MVVGSGFPLGVLEQGEAGRDSGVPAGGTAPDQGPGGGREPALRRRLPARASNPERPGPAGAEAWTPGLPAKNLSLAPGGRIYLAC